MKPLVASAVLASGLLLVVGGPVQVDRARMLRDHAAVLRGTIGASFT